jgi:hypothetical protein
MGRSIRSKFFSESLGSVGVSSLWACSMFFTLEHLTNVSSALAADDI